MHSVAESEIYLRLVKDILTQIEQEELVVYLAHHPECGDVIPHSGGCRKLRWQRKGMGKTRRFTGNLF